MHFIVIGKIPDISVSLRGTSDFPSLGNDPAPSRLCGRLILTSQCLGLAGAGSHSARTL